MTEAEWNACTDPTPMLEFLQTSGLPSNRKLRLFACACCRLIWDFPNDDRARQAVEVGDRYVDGVVTSKGPVEAYVDVCACLYPLGRRYTPHVPVAVLDSAFIAFLRTTSVTGAYYGQPWEYSHYDAYQCARDAADRVTSVAAWAGKSAAAFASTRNVEAVLLRDLYGPLPFREVHLDPAWLAWSDGAVQKLAEAAYEERSLPDGRLHRTQLAVLVDALEGAGCADHEILGHLRGPGPHVRGCWVVDLLLNKG
jgi:hypothetical protein